MNRTWNRRWLVACALLLGGCGCGDRALIIGQLPDSGPADRGVAGDTRRDGTAAWPDGAPEDGGTRDADSATDAWQDARAGDGASDASSDGPWGAASDAANDTSVPDGSCADPTTDPQFGWAQWPMPDPAGPVYPSYAVGAETVKDLVTGLTWQRNATTQTFTWQQGKEYCANLSLGGLTCWRLPSRIELVSIVDYTRSDPAIDAAVFPDTPSGWFWSASSYAGMTGAAWAVNFGFGGGNACSGGMGFAVNVRCVR
ncbi:MAG TPA: DUF1566 domain-containing protein [Polyangia bacterium]|jgi:hypothetical protein